MAILRVTTIFSLRRERLLFWANRDKQSICLDLKEPTDADAFRQLSVEPTSS